MSALYRHGDVLIAAIDAIPAGAPPVAGLVLARGEATGHAHRVVPRGSAELASFAGLLYLRVSGDAAAVTHEEHATITLPPGAYRLWRQREYVPGPARAHYIYD